MAWWKPVVLALALTSCAIPPADQPAAPNRMGRFMGLIANCGCSDIGAERMLAEYPRAVAGLYSEADVKAMHGYVDVGASEKYDNQIVICRSACSQTCMVNSVAKPLGGRLSGDGRTCLVSERDLHLTEGIRNNTGGHRPW
ncbi:MAG TPA: hypothetical protein VK196_06265 [Magnetospirillum sp.]|nr:hypothetical protein [Magnetospirillum sp.]